MTIKSQFDAPEKRLALVTGFPGFLAGRLIPGLLSRGRTIVALVEPHMADRARAAAPAGVTCVEGDITRPRLGLPEEVYWRLAENVAEVFHLAAVYDLAVDVDLARRVNVEGTRHVVDFTHAAKVLRRHLYVSTAYVAGLRRGLVLESELETGQAFANAYESTKHAAEVLVREAMGEVPTTIFRPAIVVGDSITGETQKFDGPYYMLRAISASRGPLPRLGDPRSPFNVVPVDFVVSAIAACADLPASAGQTLHLVDPDPVSSAELFALLAAAYDGRKPRVPVPPRILDRAFRSARVRAAYGGVPRESLQYLNHLVRFDTTRATELLGSAGVVCPPFADYVGSMVAFFKKHERDPAYRPAHEAA